ncbi:MAG: hypothetical protein ACOCUF_01415 [Patescibacteria group bacterium]
MALFQDLTVVCPECFEVRTECVDRNKNEVKTSYYYKENQHQVVHYLICPECRQKQEKERENEFVQEILAKHEFYPKEAIEILAREVYHLKKSRNNYQFDPRTLPFKQSA